MSDAAPTPSTLPSHVRHLIVGAGFGGLGMAIKLANSGRRDFVVIDKGADVGGTWRDNTYPGAACDVPSQLYSYSFALNRSWSRSFSPQPEIWAYMQKVARDAGVLDNFVFNTSVEEMRWDDDARLWRVTTSAGSLTAEVVIAASGGLSEPKMPDIDGIEEFAGDLFHSAQWNHDVDLTGKRVAVIGTGASAIQIIPQVAKLAAHVDVYQRTPAWVMPRNDREYTSLEHWAFEHVPGFQRAYRTAIYFGLEARVPMFTRFPKVANVASKMALANMHKAVKDPALREKLTPQYTMGCKRILISNDYYPALAQDHVDVVTDGIAKVTPTAVVTNDGTEREIDVLIVATGFYTTEIPITEHIYGRDGVQLAELWAKEGTAAYKGTTIKGFPNYFHIVGPNTGLGHSSMVFIIESQIAYISDALATMERRGAATLEVTQAAQDRWNTDLQRDMQKTVWNTGGCSSWYLDDHGRNVTLWPYTTMRFRVLLSRFDPSKYDLVAETPAAGAQTEEEKVSA